MAINELIKEAMTTNKERARFAYIAPTYGMAKRIAWDYMKYYTSVVEGVKYNESELRVDFMNGARIMLLGVENANNLRGIYLDGCVLDEFAQMPPSVYREIILPTLSDRQGWCIFCGTPMGKNHFWDMLMMGQKDPAFYTAVHKVSETKLVMEEELKKLKEMMGEDEYEQEYECSFSAAIKGAFYSTEIKFLHDNQRIKKEVYREGVEVHTAWDLGLSDDTAIIFFQIVGDKIGVIDTYSNNGEALPHYFEKLRTKEYKYGKHFAPWDARIASLTNNKSCVDIAKEHGVIFEVLPSTSVQDGIQLARQTFKSCFFEEETTRDLVNALNQYRREWDDKRQAFKINPLHDWTSHYSDSFRYLASAAKSLMHKEDDDAEYHGAMDNYLNS